MPGAPELIFPQAVLIFPSQDGPLITFATNVHDVLLGNQNFQSPDPPLSVFKQHITEYSDAQTKAGSKAKGTAKARNAKRKQVKTDLHHLRDYIQSVAEKADSPADAAALITSVFLSIKKSATRNKAELAARNTGISGQVLLDAKAIAPETTYFFEFSTDQKNWSRVPETMKCKTIVSGLTPATTYYFRFRALSRKGKTATSDPRVALVPASTPNTRGEVPPSAISEVGRASETVKSV